MSVLREEEFETFLKRRLAGSNGVLIHGGDASAVSMLARSVVKQMGGDTQIIDIPAAKAAPGGFMDHMLSLSLLGDRQVLQVDGADDTCLKFLDSALAHQQPCNFVLITSGVLTKSSKLRVAVESASLIASFAIYDEDEAVARTRVSTLLAKQGLIWGAGAEQAFFDTVGHERTIVTSEIEKLSLYSFGQQIISVEDIAAICGDVASFEVDELIDAVLSGNLETSDRIFASLGADQQKFFPLFALHLAKLQSFRSEMENGASSEAVLRNAKPPIFFKRKNAISNQLRGLSLADVVNIQESLQAAIFQSRKMADLSNAILGRALLAVARLCRTKVAA